MRYLSILWFLLWKIVQNNCCFRVFIFIFPVLKVSITMVISLFRVACSSYNSFFFRFSRNTRLVNCTLNCISECFKCSFPVTIPFSCNTRLPSRIFATEHLHSLCSLYKNLLHNRNMFASFNTISSNKAALTAAIQRSFKWTMDHFWTPHPTTCLFVLLFTNANFFHLAFKYAIRIVLFNSMIWVFYVSLYF